MINEETILATVNQIKPMYDHISSDALKQILEGIINMIEEKKLSKEEIEHLYIYLINDCGMSSSPSIPFSQSADGIDCTNNSSVVQQNQSIMFLDEDTSSDMVLHVAKQLLFCIEL